MKRQKDTETTKVLNKVLRKLKTSYTRDERFPLLVPLSMLRKHLGESIQPSSHLSINEFRKKNINHRTSETRSYYECEQLPLNSEIFTESTNFCYGDEGVMNTMVGGDTFSFSDVYEHVISTGTPPYGKVVVIDFSATWCGPCLNHIPTADWYFELYGAHNGDFIYFEVLMDMAPNGPYSCTQWGNLGTSGIRPVVPGYTSDGSINGLGYDYFSTFGDTDVGVPMGVVFDRAGRVIHTSWGAIGYSAWTQLIGPEISAGDDTSQWHCGPPPVPLIGDVNGDGVVDVTDAVQLVEFILENGDLNQPYDWKEPMVNTPGSGMVGIPAFHCPNCDVNGDGFINVVDIVDLIEIIFGGRI